MADTVLVTAARQWVTESYPYNSNHLLKALDWLDRLAPDAAEAVRLATLTHDMERAFPGPDSPTQERIDGLWADDEYNKLHSARSARIVGAWLREQSADALLVEEVERLITAHEIGGWPEANLVQTADSLSFLETNIDLFLNMTRTGKRTLDEVMIKFYTIYERIQVTQARELALPLYEAAKERVRELLKEMPDAVGNGSTYLIELLLKGVSKPDIYWLIWDMRAPFHVIKNAAKMLEESAASQEKLSNAEVLELIRTLRQNADRASDWFQAFFGYFHLQQRYAPEQEKPSS